MRNKLIRLPPTLLPQTNQAAELTTITVATEENNGIPALYIESDSRYTINALTQNLTQHKDQGYIGMANMKILCATVTTLRNRKGKTMLKWVKWVKGHSGHPRNKGVDQMANLGAQKEHPVMVMASG